MAASLWTRRRMSIHGAVTTPLPQQIALMIMDSNTACPSLSLQTPSSPSFSPRTPTLLTNFLDDEWHPSSARRDTDAMSSAWSDSPSVGTSASLMNHPTWLTVADHTPESKWTSSATAQIRADLRMEIDMAALATEVALSTLDSDSESSTDSSPCNLEEHVPVRRDSGRRKPRLRLLPDYARVIGDNDDDVAIAQRLARDRNSEITPSLCSGTTATEASYGKRSPNTPLEINHSEQGSRADGEHTGSRSSFAHLDGNDADGNDAEKPIRKGRARMSQEKRRRLARRREREAMLLGLPPRSASAPAHQTSFLGYQEMQQDCSRVPMQSSTTPNNGMHGEPFFVRSVSTPQLSVVDCSHVEPQPSCPPPRSLTHDHLCLLPAVASGMVRRASSPTALQYGGSNNQLRGSAHDGKQRPLFHHHHQRREHPMRSVLLSDAKPTIIARSPVFGSWPSLIDAQSSGSRVTSVSSGCSPTSEK